MSRRTTNITRFAILLVAVTAPVLRGAPAVTREAFARARMSGFEVQRKNVAAGVAIGAAAGLAVGLMLSSRADYGDSQQYVTTSSTSAPVVALLGGAVGALIGAIAAPSRWVRVFPAHPTP